MPRSTRPVFGSLLGVGLALAALVGSGLVSSGCQRGGSAAPAARAEKPTLRLYVIGGAAGAIEPCGCVADMLGGIDHAAAFLRSQKDRAPHSLFVGAGPMLFADPTIRPEDRDQARFKSETLAASFRDTGLVAWAPGANDFAFGGTELERLAASAGAQVLGANLSLGDRKLAPHRIVSSNGIDVGLLGVALPRSKAGLPSDVAVGDAKAAMEEGARALRAAGADLLVLLLAAHRGDALRLAEAAGEFSVIVLGKGFDEGENNDAPFPPELVGNTLVVQGPNHLQGFAIVDLFVRDGSFRFADGSGLEVAARKDSLTRRLAALDKRIAALEAAGGGSRPGDLAARRADRQKIASEIAALPEVSPPASGSYLLYQFVEVRETLGRDGEVGKRLEAYYRRVNDHNRTLFADRKPVPAGPDEASFVGVDACSTCHAEERKVWDATAHAGAYETLTRDHKEFNLDCVSCHVTGYEKPGGSTVTHVDRLTDVQCETCHGAGSLHAKNPLDDRLIRRVPDLSLCASSCHHPPHVGADWDLALALPKILGPGHGR